MTNKKFNLAEVETKRKELSSGWVDPDRVACVQIYGSDYNQMLQIIREFPCKECKGLGKEIDYSVVSKTIYIEREDCPSCQGGGKEYV